MPLLAAAALASASPLPGTGTRGNRTIVTEFARLFYHDKNPKLAFERFVAPDYIQHNPGIADGRDAAIAALAPMFASPGRRFTVERILVDGDLAAIYIRVRSPDAPRGAAVADFYRLAHGRFVEHRDVLQSVPARAANSHPMF
ncbi:polyketide cyclase [Sphingomonas ginkgonis]|uniref:Polyketide cyclase n=1 Tax=Sphingomonas ginkgonis TaxID=2315330 RepID=A0A429V9Q0_9SPHN|nr:nuclear transport factor 2 family protein [Sphingomonas ginkgonis]RST30656.1 polyketide cyclase [Sphingomonas ginkgonis]